MDSSTEDPPGFCRVENPDGRPYYLTIPKSGGASLKLRNMSKVKDYLRREGIVELGEKDFDFQKRKGNSSVHTDSAPKSVKASQIFDEDMGEAEVDMEVVDKQAGGNKWGKFDMNNLLTNGVDVDHKERLQQTAKVLDEFRQRRGAAHDEGRLLELKTAISSATSIQDVVAAMSSFPEALEEMSRVVQDSCFEELLFISRAEGRLPLSEWPNDKSSNWFSDVCLQAAQVAPNCLSLLLKFMVRSIEENLMPIHVIQTATVFAQLAEKVDHQNDALLKITALQLKFDGMTDNGVDALGRLGLSQSSRSYKNQRDFFAEVSESVALEDFKHMPEQYTLDNCTTKGQDCTVEYRQTETLATEHLSTRSSSPEEVMSLFSIDMLLVTSPELHDEFQHLQNTVVPLVVAREIASHRTELANWLQLFPEHHHHSQSHQPLMPAKSRLVAPHHAKVFGNMFNKFEI